MGTILGSVGLFWFAPPANPAPYTLYPLDLIRGWKGHDPCDWDNQKSYLQKNQRQKQPKQQPPPTLFELTSLATKNRHSHLGATQPLIASSGNLQVLNHPQQGCPTAALGQNPALWSLPGSQWESSWGQELEACSLEMKSTSRIPPRSPLSAQGNWIGASRGSPGLWPWRWDPSAPTRRAMGRWHPLAHSGCGFRCRFHSRWEIIYVLRTCT